MTGLTPTSQDSDQRLVLQYGALFAGVGFLLAVAAIAAVVFAGRYDNTATAARGTSGAGQSGAVSAAAPQHTSAVSWRMYADSNHKVKGPDGKWHDAMIPGDPTVQAGKVTVTAYNYDTAVHTINSSALGLAEKIPPAQGNTPGKLTFTFTAKPGKYQWICIMPCDPWAMTHNGYMRGYITVKA
jgi:plastocyanin